MAEEADSQEANLQLLAKFAQMTHTQGALQSDPLSLSNSDNPGTQLTTMRFDGTNFFAWSGQIRMALSTKLKLGFLDGTVKKLEEDSSDFARWSRADGMVACWLVNSMTPELSSTFVYTGCAKDLWMEILERYSQSNAPMVFQLKLEIMRTMQGNLSVTAYYSKLKKCWDELQYMNGVPACTCGALGKCTCRVLDRMKELESQDKLMQFLANLSGEYDSVKSQILSSDPLPSVSKAYYTVLQVEKQKQIGSTVPESTAFMASFGAKGNTNHRASYSEKRDNSKGKSVEKKLCSHCNKTEHLFEECFEIIGYPDWYKGKQNKRSQGYSSRVASHVDRGQNSTPLDRDEEESIEKYDHLDPKFVKAMCSEMMKVFKSKMPTPTMTNFSGPSE